MGSIARRIYPKKCDLMIFCNIADTPTKASRMSPTLGAAAAREDQYTDRQFVVIVSEKQARVVGLPSQNCVYRQQLADTDFIVKAEIISLKGMEILFSVRFSVRED